ncbi:Mobile element protein [Richelia intracellularis]|nr:Mobile element protein [Richelia intracellularis]
MGHKNGDLSITEVKSYAKDAKGLSEGTEGVTLMVSLTTRLAPTGFKSSKPKIKSSKNLSIANATALT